MGYSHISPLVSASGLLAFDLALPRFRRIVTGPDTGSSACLSQALSQRDSHQPSDADIKEARIEIDWC